MTTGGLVSLVAKGQQDLFLVANPEVTLFKVVYRRHTNFAMEMIEHSMSSGVNFGNRPFLRVQRNGDLMKEVYLKVKLPEITPSEKSKFAWCRRVGHALINEVEIEVGGTSVDKQYGSFLNIWYELTRGVGQTKSYLKMIGDVPELTKYDGEKKYAKTLLIPLQFWFNRNTGLALPLIALQYHDVTLKFRFEDKQRLIVCNESFKNNDMSQVRLEEATVLINYIFLDNDERQKFAQLGHEYLIEQLQHVGNSVATTKNLKYKIDFNHPTKELIWGLRLGNYKGKEFMCYTHKDEWDACGPCGIINECATKVLQESIVLLNAAVTEPDPYGGDPIIITPAESPPNNGGAWEAFVPGANAETPNEKIKVVNNSTDKTLWVNQDSLVVENVAGCPGGIYSLTGKISADITVGADNLISILNIKSTLTVRDLSIPIYRMLDTRNTRDDPIVWQHHNFGVFIDGSVGPVESVLIQFNGTDRFRRQEGAFFNYLQPLQHHTNGPSDGIYVYSFADKPELHQPTGATNFSRLESVYLDLVIADPTFRLAQPELGFLNNDNELLPFGICHNVFRVISGMGGVAFIS